MTIHLRPRFWLVVISSAGLAQPPSMQAPAAPDWQIAAGGKMAFEVASVKLDPGPFRPPNFPLDPGEAYRPVGGRFNADFPVFTYITFAYKLSLAQDQRQAMIAHLPDWVAADRFAVEARAEGNPTKDQMRLMMQSLLADRFKLKAHFETQVVPAMALVLVKPGKTGPKLRPHSEGVPCEATPATNGPMPRPTPDGPFPPVCDTYMMMVNPNNIARAGSRNTTMALLADALPGIGGLNRPVVDQTGVGGRLDFTLEFWQEVRRTATPNSDAPPPDPQGPSFLDALREQLGVKLESTKAPLRVMVIDHIERPSEN
jgi:uncharacterized protein (TIGR03435 family)